MQIDINKANAVQASKNDSVISFSFSFLLDDNVAFV